MPNERPPSLDPIAASRWAHLPLKTSVKAVQAESPWLHEEVARRMADRLAFIRLQPKTWVCWNPLRAGLNALALLQKIYPKSQGHLTAERPGESEWVKASLNPPWWKLQAWCRQRLQTGALASHSMDMVWANMLLHQQASPQELLAEWHRVLAVDGFLMFSCLGPDTLRELNEIYQSQGWPPACHAFTDMHDWGDMLVQAGFAEPVMDMERITLSYETPERLLAELRELGRNLHVQRFAGLRGRRWRADWLQALTALARPDEQGRLCLTFEVVYGHALKPVPRHKVQSESQIGLQDMRQMLSAKRP